MLWRFLRPLWSILDPVTFDVDLPPAVCLGMLGEAARPSASRLYLRDTFTEGRRYHITQTADGFRMSTTSHTLFNRHRRTQPGGYLTAQLAETGKASTKISIRGHLRPMALVYGLWIPLGTSILVWTVPWPPPLVIGLVAMLFSLAWSALKYGAAYEANEMIFFIRKTFEDVPQHVTKSLPAESGDIVGGETFDALWNRLLKVQSNEQQQP